MAHIPPLYLDTVVAIGAKNDRDELVWIGTGFLVGRETEPGSEQFHTFLVTNKHVLKEQKIAFFRINPQSNEKATDYPIVLKDDQNNVFWTGHPLDEIDVAVFPFSAGFLKSEKMQCSFFEPHKHIISKKEMIESGVSEGDFVYVLGFPMNLVDSERKYVIARSGIIARIKNFLDGFSKDFLIDSFVFPGNSGGPVINKTEISGIQNTKILSNSYLIGMIQSYIPYRDVAISLQTKEVRSISVENSGLASVIPTDFILETIEIAYLKAVKNEK